VQGVVRAAVEPVAVGLAAGGGDRGDAAQMGERSFGSHPVGVVSDGDQQLSGDLNTNPVRASSAGAAVVTSWCCSPSAAVISMLRCR
jgi:hypothetical protein